MPLKWQWNHVTMFFPQGCITVPKFGVFENRKNIGDDLHSWLMWKNEDIYIHLPTPDDWQPEDSPSLPILDTEFIWKILHFWGASNHLKHHHKFTECKMIVQVVISHNGRMSPNMEKHQNNRGVHQPKCWLKHEI